MAGGIYNIYVPPNILILQSLLLGQFVQIIFNTRHYFGLFSQMRKTADLCLSVELFLSTFRSQKLTDMD